MNPKKFFFSTLVITGILFLVPALIVAAFDPFFFFHKHFAGVGFDSTDRYQNAGLINSFLADPGEKIDTIIVGTSMSQNLPVSTFKNANGVNALKLTAAGIKARELRAILEKAIATGHVKKVVWEVFTSYSDYNPESTHLESPLPMFLYNDTALDDWRYFFNNDVFEKVLKNIKGKRKKEKNLEELYTWTREKEARKFSSPENLNSLASSLQKAQQRGDLPVTQTPPDHTRKDFPNIEKNLLPLLREHPEIEFELFFPPVSYYAYAADGNKSFWLQMTMRKKILEETKNLKNVRVYGFDLIPGKSDNLKNYMDKEHYNHAISADIAQFLARHEHILREKDWPVYSQKLVKRVNSFVRDFTKKAPEGVE